MFSSTRFTALFQWAKTNKPFAEKGYMYLPFGFIELTPLLVAYT